jgi:hypothetical protein
VSTPCVERAVPLHTRSGNPLFALILGGRWAQASVRLRSSSAASLYMAAPRVRPPPLPPEPPPLPPEVDLHGSEYRAALTSEDDTAKH